MQVEQEEKKQQEKQQQQQKQNQPEKQQEQQSVDDDAKMKELIKEIKQLESKKRKALSPPELIIDKLKTQWPKLTQTELEDPSKPVK